MNAILHLKRVTRESKFAGIYIIINHNNGKYYVGSSSNLWKRRYAHFYELNKNTHRNPYLQNAFNLDGDYFQLYLIERVDDLAYLIEREQYWINELNAVSEGYNIVPFAGGSRLGLRHSPETIEKLRKAATGVRMTEEQVETMRRRMIGHTVSDVTREKMRKAKVGFTHSEETKRHFSEIRSIPVLQLTKDGDIVREWNSMTDAEIEGFDRAHISKCCRGNRKSHGGYIWAFKDDFIKKSS